MCDWVTLSLSLHATSIASYITSHHVLGDIIQPAWDSAIQMITRTGVFFISSPNTLELGYFKSPFNSLWFCSHSPSTAHKEDTVMVSFPWAHMTYELVISVFSIMGTERKRPVSI